MAVTAMDLYGHIRENGSMVSGFAAFLHFLDVKLSEFPTPVEFQHLKNITTCYYMYTRLQTYW